MVKTSCPKERLKKGKNNLQKREPIVKINCLEKRQERLAKMKANNKKQLSQETTEKRQERLEKSEQIRRNS